MATARFRVEGQLDSAGSIQRGTVTIDRAAGLFTVRPLRRHKVYELPLDAVATIVCQKIIMAEAAAKRREKKAKQKLKGLR